MSNSFIQTSYLEELDNLLTTYIFLTQMNVAWLITASIVLQRIFSSPVALLWDGYGDVISFWWCFCFSVIIWVS